MVGQEQMAALRMDILQKNMVSWLLEEVVYENVVKFLSLEDLGWKR